tara:strand:+ start:225 stop:452 length:228 start_codon:yes stop_codon:yes gene_type:complete
MTAEIDDVEVKQIEDGSDWYFTISFSDTSAPTMTSGSTAIASEFSAILSRSYASKLLALEALVEKLRSIFTEEEE